MTALASPDVPRSSSYPHLVAKYAVPAPRYTSYPTVPSWSGGVDGRAWGAALRSRAARADGPLPVGLYVHLPFCESLCSFCGCHKIVTRNHAVEDSYVRTLLAEWELHRAAAGADLVVNALHFGGGTPTFFSPGALATLLEGLAPSFTCEAGCFEGSLEAHPNSTTPEHLDVLAAHGFRRLSVGVQDFDPRVQAAVDRVQSVETVERVVREARARGFDGINFDLIHGLPLQTVASMRETFEDVLRLHPDRIAYYAYAHVPTLKPSQARFAECDLPGPLERRALFDAGRDLLLANGYGALGMDHFARAGDPLAVAAREGRLHRNFMGYAVRPEPVLVGLGISSIGEIDGELFAQNAKALPEWRAAVEAEELPIVTGHALDDEDRLVRRQILELMCRGETRWETALETTPSLAAALRRLVLLERDGLVEVNALGVKVTQIGRDFIRNVCMTLDARLWRSKPRTQLFSNAV